MTALALQPEGEDWRLCLTGDWSLGATARIDQELEALPMPASGTSASSWPAPLDDDSPVTGISGMFVMDKMLNLPSFKNLSSRFNPYIKRIQA